LISFIPTNRCALMRLALLTLIALALLYPPGPSRALAQGQTLDDPPRLPLTSFRLFLPLGNTNMNTTITDSDARQELIPTREHEHNH
jgi:hypothetical protein